MGRGPGVRAASASSVQIDFRFAGVRCREKISLCPTPANLKYAAKLKARIEHEILLGQFDYAKHFPTSPRAKLLSVNRSGQYTMRQVLNHWLDTVERQLERETFEEYATIIRNVWIPKYGDWAVGDFTGNVARAWVAEQTCSRKRILNILTPLRQALTLAVQEEILRSYPLANLKVIRPDGVKNDRDVDPLSPSEFAAVAATMRPEIANAMTFWVWTGLREGELVALQWPDIDMDRSVARITKASRGNRVKAPKTRKGNRDAPLLQPALEALRRQQAHTRLMGKAVFLNPEWRPRAGSRWAIPKPGPWTEKALRNAWQAGCVAAGVRYRPVKQLRHTFASWMLSAGEQLMWVSKAMGHNDPSITQRVYARFIPEAFPDAGSRAVAAVAAIAKAL
jgi:integrase